MPFLHVLCVRCSTGFNDLAPIERGEGIVEKKYSPEKENRFKTEYIDFIGFWMEVHHDEQSLSYVNTTEEILKELEHSKEHGNVVGINALSLGPGMIMTAVEDIIEVKNDKIIVLMENDLLGIRLPETELLLSEIVRIHPFVTKYNDPFHIQLREHKKPME